MTAAAKKKAPKEFDHTKLAALTEPIMLYVSRMVGNKQQPIDLPVRPGENYPGKGWTQEDILQLPSFLATKWSGGGLYNCKATGDNGESMEWDIYFPPNQIPERQPPSMSAGQAGSAPVVPLPVAPPPQGQHAGVIPPTWMDAAANQYQPAAQVPMSSPYVSGYGFPYYPQAGYGAPPAPYGGLLPGSLFGGNGRRDEDRYQTEREARLSLEARIERERMESGHRQQLDRLTAEVAQTRELLNRRPSGDDDPALKAARAEIEALRQQQSQNQIMTMIQQNAQQTQQLISELRASTQQQIQALQSAITAAPRGPDPMIMMMVETSKANADAQRAAAQAQAQAQVEVARLQADAARESSRSTMDLITRLNGNTADLSQAYRGAMELMQQGVETVLNMQQPSMHPALEMVGQAAQGALGIAQQYVAGKQQTEQAQAQAQAMSAQAQAMSAARGGPPAALPAHAPAAAAPPRPVVVNTAQRDDAAYFGPAHTAVQQFRAAVATGNVAPAQAAQGIVQAINHFATQGKAGSVPAFDLWRKGELAELVDALLPGAPTSYREQTTQALYALLQQLRAQQGGNKPTSTPN